MGLCFRVILFVHPPIYILETSLKQPESLIQFLLFR